MRILLLGDYSGYCTNLKKGLENLGHDVTLASTSDGWKKIEGSNYVLYKTGSKNLISAFYNLILYPILHIRDLYDYDIVQIVCPVLYPLSINGYMTRSIIEHSKKSFISVAGNCYSVYKSWADGSLGYYTYDDNPEAYQRFTGNSSKAIKFREQEEYLYKNTNGIISIQYEYAVGVRDRSNFLGTIQLPMDCSSIPYTPNIVNGKIRIAHGIIKEKFKGTSYIIEAMNIIKEKYPDDVELMIDGKMPLNDYLKWLSSANILIDQCKEHAYGLNAMYAMAMGKIVLGGATEKSLKEHNLDTCPVFHIEPNVAQIVSQLETVIARKHDFEQMGFECRKFVEEFHDCTKVARRYVEFWEKAKK